MNRTLQILGLGCLLATSTMAAQPALTIYNQNFAVVRDTVPLDLKAGVNEVRYADATAHVEPDSVILRDPAGHKALHILEQNYRNDPVSQELLLSLFEGKTIEFETIRTKDNTQVRELIPGKIIRSGYVPGGFANYGEGGGMEQPIIEVNGRLQFSLPGQPLFPSLGDDTVLKPALKWLLRADQAGKFDAEISYVTAGFTWEADYNLVAPEKGDTVDLIGWITMNNQSGKTFENAKIKLMAGDVNKIQPMSLGRMFARGSGGGGGGGEPVVAEKSFDEYHLYTVARPATLRDRQMKQVEFVRAAGVHAPVIYIYDGADSGCRFSGGLNDDRNYGTRCNKKVWVAREFVNAETNRLGTPLPKGKLRFYRRNDDGQLEFTGEDTIDHTPRNETVHVNTGNAFDLVGERKQAKIEMHLFNSGAFPAIDPATGLPATAAVAPATGLPSTTNTTNTVPEGPWIEESFEITLRNRKKEPVEIRVVEHLYRWSNWTITKKSSDFKKTDVQTIEFRIPLRSDEEKVVSYTVHYSW
jgi:hypothetical protein